MKQYKKLFITAILGITVTTAYGQSKRIDHEDGSYDIVKVKGPEIHVNHYDDNGNHTGGEMFQAADISFEKVVDGLIYEEDYGQLPRRQRSVARHEELERKQREQRERMLPAPGGE